MSRNNPIEVTVRGRLAAEPVLLTSASGIQFTRFRLASTPRIHDRALGTWSDGQTEWLTVTVFGKQFALNVARSLHKGQPVVVSGFFTTGAWTDKEGRPRTELRILARTVGHDLFWGRAEYFKTAEAPPGSQIPGEPPTGTGQVDDAGLPQSPLPGDLADLPELQDPVGQVEPGDPGPVDLSSAPDADLAGGQGEEDWDALPG
ncbi:MAG: single-stranded DNA-binding protein [Bifidobacteriaceae bacterium]|jgi:single-strand DNA-binding protein|nr:single-stranded DNA-binding protein [Bifidobacteriaceae bacterium]